MKPKLTLNLFLGKFTHDNAIVTVIDSHEVKFFYFYQT